MVVKISTQVGNPVIRKKSKAVVSFGLKTTKNTIKNLIDSMRHHNLVGMAAPQIGVNLRIFVTEIRKTKLRKTNETDKVRVFINPKIKKYSKRQVSAYEGCGSVASSGLFGKVMRSYEVAVEAYDENGKKFKLQAKGLLARIIQHESDHLDGKIFLDRLTDTKSLMSRGEYLKTKKS